MGTLICCGLLYVILLCKCFKKKKPADPAPHAPATVLFPGFAAPAKADGIVTPCLSKSEI